MSIFSDLFTGSGALSAHTSDSGHSWTAIDSPSAANEMHLSGGIAALDGVDAVNETGYYSSLTPPTANYTVTMRIKAVNVASPVYPSMRARLDHTTGNCYRVFYDKSTDHLVLRKEVGGVVTVLQTTTIPGMSNGDFVDVRLVLNGASLTVGYGINGSALADSAPVSDSAISAAGTIGLASYNAVSAAQFQGFDSLTVDAGAASADFTTTQAGNWNTGSTWVGGSVPGFGAGKTVQINHAVAVDVNIDVGASSATDSDPAIAIASGASLSFNNGISATVRGSIVCNNGGVTLGNGVTITFDASSAGSPTARHYFLQLGTSHNQTGARLVSNGTSGAPNVIQTVSGSGNAYVTSASLLRGGLATCTFTTFLRIGTSSQVAWDFWASSDADVLDFIDCTFDACGKVTTVSGFSGGSLVRFQRVTFKNCVASIALELSSSDPLTVGTRVVDDCRMGAGFNHYAVDLTVKNTVFQGLYTSLASSNATAATWFNNLLYANGVQQSVPAGTKKDFIVINDTPSNPHWLQEMADRDGVIDGAVFECPDIAGDGDADCLPPCSTPTNYTLKNSILVNNGLGLCPGNILNSLTNANGTVLAIEHNSLITNGSGGGINCGETYLGRSDLFKSIKSNLAIGAPGTTDGYIIQRISGSSVQDMCLPANFDYNGGENLGTGTDGVGVNAQSGPNFFSTSVYGAHDVFGAAGLADITVSISKWDYSLSSTVSKAVAGITRSGSTATANRTAHGYRVGDWVGLAGATQGAYNGRVRITAVGDADHFSYAVTGAPTTPATGTITITNEGTVAHALSQLVARASGYSVAALLAYYRAGWTPTASRYKGTAHDGGDIGAVAAGGGTPPALHGFGGGRGGYLGGYLN